MRTIGERITFRRCFACEFLQIVHFKREMSQIRTYHHRAALVEFADLDFFFAFGGFEKNELRSPSGRMTPGFLQSEHVFVKRHRLLQIVHPVARVKQFLNHRVSYCPVNRLNSNSSPMKLVIAATGASGSIYLQRLLEQINTAAHEIHLVLRVTPNKSPNRNWVPSRFRKGSSSMARAISMFRSSAARLDLMPW